MNYWLLKTEPDTYSWADLVRDKKTVWDGVKNFQARKNLKGMKSGDLVFIYHTGSEKSIVGIAQVKKESYPDPKDNEWVVVELAPKKALKNPVTLATVKADKKLTAMALVKYARLSVQPVKQEEFDRILELGEPK
jgi:predicted RNA-binding protein with PUA-like domain